MNGIWKLVDFEVCFDLCKYKILIDMVMKVKRVLMFVNLVNFFNGIKSEKMDISKYVIYVFIIGVCFFLLIFEKGFGNRLF